MTQGSFTTAGGTELATYRWLPKGTVRSHVYLLHGFAEHSGRYGELATILNGAGHALHSIDHLGHGLSQGRRAWVPGPQSLAETYLEFLAAEPEEERPRVLLGHSMGGAAAAQVALRAQDGLLGLVLSSPYLQPPKPPAGILLGVLGLLSRVAPGVVVERLDSAHLSRQPRESAAYDADPLVHRGGVPAISAHSLLQAGREVLARAPELQLPLLILHGARDAIAGVEGSRRLLAAAGSRDKQMIEFPEAMHEVLNDLDRGEFHEALLDWLDYRLD